MKQEWKRLVAMLVGIGIGLSAFAYAALSTKSYWQDDHTVCELGNIEPDSPMPGSASIQDIKCGNDKPKGVNLLVWQNLAWETIVNRGEQGQEPNSCRYSWKMGAVECWFDKNKATGDEPIVKYEKHVDTDKYLICMWTKNHPERKVCQKP